jgi:hypothetical protein
VPPGPDDDAEGVRWAKLRGGQSLS